MCRLLGVKRNNFYSYQKRSLNKVVDPDHDEIIELLTRMAESSDHTYGERRMQKALNALGSPISR